MAVAIFYEIPSVTFVISVIKRFMTPTTIALIAKRAGVFNLIKYYATLVSFPLFFSSSLPLYLSFLRSLSSSLRSTKLIHAIIAWRWKEAEEIRFSGKDIEGGKARIKRNRQWHGTLRDHMADFWRATRTEAARNNEQKFRSALSAT
jgi:hypothetical protein